MAAALQKAMLIIKGRHRTLLEQKTEAKAETTTIVNLNNTVRVEPAARTSSDIPDHQPKQDKARPDPSDQYGVLTRHQRVKEPLEDYCKEVRRVRNIFINDDMLKYIFVRGLADEILRKEVLMESIRNKNMTLDDLITKTRELKKILQEAERISSDYNSKHQPYES
jgi:hypothetical protein